MGTLKLLLIILSFFAVAAMVFLAGSFLADHVLEQSARRHADEQANAAAVLIPVYFLAKFVICPIVSIGAGILASWKVAKSKIAV
jgi:hypothetical protein